MVKNKEDIIKIISSPEVVEYLRSQGIEHISLFGSYATGEQNKESDIDLLYEETNEGTMGWEIFEIMEYLQEKLKRKIDFIDRNYLNFRIKENILSTKIDII